MLNVYKYILESVSKGNMTKEDATTILQMLKQTEVDKNEDIAIVGIAGKYPLANDVQEYWENLKEGTDCIRDFPEIRKNDMDSYLVYTNKYSSIEEIDYQQCAYLDEIDKFDYKFFRMSPMEASLMDPNQRLFLETAYEALEDSGYGGKALAGSRTGVYIGYSNDLRETYAGMLANTSPSLLPMSIAGNLSSIIPSRISYFLDLKGPSLVVDTACSSSLLSVHLACEGLRNGECTMAIAGGIKINLLTLQDQVKIGIESSTQRTRSFDNFSDGTGIGEGVGVVVLKPLKQALLDGDNIYAVIKGSAINQDGTSAGITAPNVESQTDVILNAWKNANIDPTTIQYIEAHGTGTKLGDPIEIDGITAAFREYTDKKQFCAIGSVKSNVGHLYEGAGIAALIKAIMALKNKMIPSTLHFQAPNSIARFENSPVYVNDRLIPWDSEGEARRCGVSAFGFSGTNCHMVMEEAPEKVQMNSMDRDAINILNLSGKTEEALVELIKKMNAYLHIESSVRIEDICFTLNMGRGHHNHRLAVLASDIEELRSRLSQLNQFGELGDIDVPWAFYGEHHLIGADKKEKGEYDITEEETRKLSLKTLETIHEQLNKGFNKSSMEQICHLYVSGADVKWEMLYEGKQRMRLSLPVYPYERKRCWMQIPKHNKISELHEKNIEIIHPLVEKYLAESMEYDIYNTSFSPQKHFILRDHVIMENYVLPGTTYLETAFQVGRRSLGSERLEFKDVIFQTPFILKDKDSEDVQLIAQKKEKYIEFTAISKDEENWSQHVILKIVKNDDQTPSSYDIGVLKHECNKEEKTINQNDLVAGFIKFGPRWLCYHKLYLGEKTALAMIELSDEFKEDLFEYHLHPSLIDMAVNAVSLTLGEKYLPLSYKSFKIFAAAPQRFYSYITRKGTHEENAETISFDIVLMDYEGKVFATAEDYVIKKVYGLESFNRPESLYSSITWIEDVESVHESSVSELKKGKVVLFKDRGSLWEGIASKLSQSGMESILVEIGNSYKKVDALHYIVGNDEYDYEKLFSEIELEGTVYILHLSSITPNEVNSSEALNNELNHGIYSLFYLNKSILNLKMNHQIRMLLFSNYANLVTREEKKINPWNASFLTLGKTLSAEYKNLKYKCIDIDDEVTEDDFITEMMFADRSEVKAIRNGKRYIELIDKLKLDQIADTPIEIKNDGVYVITGGTGGIGIEICRYLSTLNNANIALINRTSIPERELWDGQDYGEKINKIIEAIRNIENTGSNIECFSADVSSERDMDAVLDGLRKKYGKINGVIHSAGLAGNGFMIHKSIEVFRTVLEPKITGAWVLAKLTEKDSMDFFVMFSSIAALMGVPGQGDYSSANAFLDAFASYQNMNGRKSLTINWPAWKETGMAVNHNANFDSIFKSIPTAMAIKSFGEVLNKDINRVIIGEWNYKLIDFDETIPIKLGQSILKKFERNRTGRISSGDQNKDIQVEIKGKVKENYDEIEITLSKQWAQVLGLDEINVYESFYDLGGDSITATRLLKLIDEVYPGIIDITDVFAYSTISKMSEYVKDKLNADKSDSEPLDKTTPNYDSLEDILERLAMGEVAVTDVDELINLEEKK